MTQREHVRVPFAARVEFRTASAFLVAYSLNLSRGGIFLETDQDVPIGGEIQLDITMPGAPPAVLVGVVTWRRGRDSVDGPTGLGVEFAEVLPALGHVIDRLVTAYDGLSIVLFAGDRSDRAGLTRLVRSIIASAEVTHASDPQVADTLLTADVDLVVVDCDLDLEAGLSVLRNARRLMPPIPTVALCSSRQSRELARAAGAVEFATNPPALPELQLVMLRALGRPAAVR